MAKPPLQFTLYLPLLGGTYFGRILKTKQKWKKWNCTCRIVAVGLSPTLDNMQTRTTHTSWGARGPENRGQVPRGSFCFVYWRWLSCRGYPEAQLSAESQNFPLLREHNLLFSYNCEAVSFTFFSISCNSFILRLARTLSTRAHTLEQGGKRRRRDLGEYVCVCVFTYLALGTNIGTTSTPGGPRVGRGIL